MTAYYRVELTVGAHSWTVRQGDPAAYGPIDGLTIEWAVPDTEPFPWQPQPVEAKFGVVVEEAAEFSADIGSMVSIAVFTDDAAEPGFPELYPPPLALFAGRVSDMEAVPHTLGTIYNIAAVDYLPDLIAKSCKDIGAGPDAAALPGAWNNVATTVRDYINRLCDLAGIPDMWPSPIDPPLNEGYWELQSLGLGLDSVFNHITRVLLSYINLGVDYYRTSGGRGVVTPEVVWNEADWTAEPDAVRPHAIWFVTKEVETGQVWTMQPGELIYDETISRWTIVVRPGSFDTPQEIEDDWPEPITAANFGIIESRIVELASVKWLRNKSQAVDTVELGWRSPAAPGGAAGGGQEHTYRHSNTTDPVPVVRTLGDLHMTNTSPTGARGQVPYVARYYLSEPDNSGPRFQADKFILRPALDNADPHRLNRLGMRQVFNPLAVLMSPVVAIADVPPRWNPNPGALDWYAGSVRAAKLSIQNGDYSVELLMDRHLPRPNPSPIQVSSYLRWTDLRNDEDLIQITWDQIDERISWHDARILRRPNELNPPDPDPPNYVDDLILSLQNLQGFWRMTDADGSAVMADSSVWGRHGVRVGTPTAVPSLITGYTNTSTDLDPGDYNYVPWDVWMNDSGVFTVWGLIRPTKVATPGAIFGRHSQSAMAWDIQFSGGRLQFRGRPSGGGGNIQTLQSNRVIAANERITFACVHNANTGLSKIYIDGVLDTQVGRSLDWGSDSNAGGIGIGSLWNGYAAQWYDGVIGPMAFIFSELSADFIATLHDAANGIAPE